MKLNWLKWIILGILLLILIAVFIAYGSFTGKMINWFGFKKINIPSSSSSLMQNIIVTKANFPIFLQSTNLVRELPNDAEIQLKFYNFDSGVRVWEENYVIQKDLVNAGEAEDPDAVVVMSSSYIDKLGNFCSAVQEARNNGDLGFEIKKSTVLLLWKYKGLMKYKSCFGY